MKDLLKCQLAILLTLLFFNFGQSQEVAMAIVPRITHIDSEHSIAKGARESGIHNTLSKAIKVAKLEEILDNDGAFTFFAPSDEAFKKFPQEKLKSLIKSENIKELRALLTYHIVAGNFSASKILSALCRGNGVATFTTLQGTKITATIDGVDIVLTDGHGNSAKITKADTNQCNGVIHVIDSVIKPSKVALP
ncbi:putative surface protein with fasciclin (FAS1) repeats [Saonia flava]|uniref:Putative surface protein with fasciclin (FAS1) repeats n=1 Tax=Saonia flava TaxID=523696 RepID=A0A846QVK6_9FLAO|nr:fasciclin domain-containing protein [Saonia flava]NJB69595.1 putative surface protein with fasciclin (FAS1) repeats [Saonia flava]